MNCLNKLFVGRLKFEQKMYSDVILFRSLDAMIHSPENEVFL
jgi:hypothetical protein